MFPGRKPVTAQSALIPQLWTNFDQMVAIVSSTGAGFHTGILQQSRHCTKRRRMRRDRAHRYTLGHCWYGKRTGSLKIAALKTQPCEYTRGVQLFGKYFHITDAIVHGKAIAAILQNRLRGSRRLMCRI